MEDCIRREFKLRRAKYPVWMKANAKEQTKRRRQLTEKLLPIVSSLVTFRQLQTVYHPVGRDYIPMCKLRSGECCYTCHHLNEAKRDQYRVQRIAPELMINTGVFALCSRESMDLVPYARQLIDKVGTVLNWADITIKK